MKCRTFCLFAMLLVLPGIGKAQSLSADPRVAHAIRILEIWLDAEVAYKNIPAITAEVVYDQQVVWSKGFGFAHVDKNIPAAPGTIFSICSISKLFTSTAIMQLRDQGKLNLDDPVKKHLPWFSIKDAFPNAPDVTVRNLLTHTSGLPREAAFPYWTGPEYNFPTREQMIEKLPSQEEFYAADDYYQYSNLGMSLLGEVVAAASGQPYADYIKQHILSPLGLKDTTPEMPENQKGGRLATSYSMRLRDGSRKAIPFFRVKGIAPAAGFASTVEDLGRFASWQFRLIEKGGSEVLAANTLKEMHRVHYLDSNWQTARGLGYSVANRNDKVIVGHNGTCPGFRTQLDMWVKEKIGVTVMGNSNDVNPGSYTRGIYDVIAPAIEGAIKSPDKAQKPDPTLEKYVGTYEQPFGGETHVLIVEGSFLRTFSVPTDNPAGRITKLKRVEGDVFQAVSEDGRPTPKVTFETGPDGKVTRMVRDINYSVKIN